MENVTEHQAVRAFKAGVRYRDLYLKFGRTGDISMSKMMEIAARYANGEEEDRIRSGKHKATADGDGNNTRKQKQKAPSTPQAEAAAVTNAKLKGKGSLSAPPRRSISETTSWTSHVQSTRRWMKRATPYIRSIPLGNVAS